MSITWRSGAGLAVLIVVGDGIGCEDHAGLDTGDSLVVSFTPSFLYVSATTSDDDCASGPVVHLLGSHADGTPADGARVQLWLSGASTATIDVDAIDLARDGTAAVCLHAGATPGSASVNARSGPITTSAMIDIRQRTVPSGGSISLAATPVTSGTASPASLCALPAVTTCIPTLPRQTSVSAQGTGTDTLAVPDDALVTLSTTLGWWADGTCTSESRLASTTRKLTGTIAAATLCFDDLGGSGVVSTRSGSVTGMLQVPVRQVPRAIIANASQSSAKVGDSIAFSVGVLDCAGTGVPNTTFRLDVTAGQIDFATGTAGLPKTGADGSVVISGTARALPATVKVSLINEPSVACNDTIALVGP